MGSIIIELRKVGTGIWGLFAPKGHQVGPTFRGDKYKAIEWGKGWVSSFHNWTLTYKGSEYDEQKN